MPGRHLRLSYAKPSPHVLRYGRCYLPNARNTKRSGKRDTSRMRSHGRCTRFVVLAGARRFLYVAAIVTKGYVYDEASTHKHQPPLMSGVQQTTPSLSLWNIVASTLYSPFGRSFTVFASVLASKPQFSIHLPMLSKAKTPATYTTSPDQADLGLFCKIICARVGWGGSGSGRRGDNAGRLHSSADTRIAATAVR